jgi:hypothetical protein
VKIRRYLCLVKFEFLIKEANFLRIITREDLSKRHWTIFTNELKPSFTNGGNFTKSNKINKSNSGISSYPYSYKLKSY